MKIRYGQQLFTQIFDKNQREQFIENNIYLKELQIKYRYIINNRVISNFVSNLKFLIKNKFTKNIKLIINIFTSEIDGPKTIDKGRNENKYRYNFF